MANGLRIHMTVDASFGTGNPGGNIGALMDRGRFDVRRAPTPDLCLTEHMMSTRLAIATVLLAAGFVLSAGCGEDEESTEPAPVEGGAADTASRPSQEAGAPIVIGPAVECTIAAAIETEPNDTPQTANAFSELGFCGVLEKPTDVDYFTFATPAGTKLSVFQGVIDGRVDFQLTLNGASFSPAETTKFGSGTYVVKAFTTAGKPASYRIRVQFDAP